MLNLVLYLLIAEVFVFLAGSRWLYIIAAYGRVTVSVFNDCDACGILLVTTTLFSDSRRFS